MAPNLRAADRVIAVSEHIADQAIELGVEAARVHVIRSGVDTERFRPRDAASVPPRGSGSASQPRHRWCCSSATSSRASRSTCCCAPWPQRARRSFPSAQLLVVGSGESAGAQDQTARLMRLRARARADRRRCGSSDGCRRAVAGRLRRGRRVRAAVELGSAGHRRARSDGLRPAGGGQRRRRAARHDRGRRARAAWCRRATLTALADAAGGAAVEQPRAAGGDGQTRARDGRERALPGRTRCSDHEVYREVVDAAKVADASVGDAQS